MFKKKKNNNIIALVLVGSILAAKAGSEFYQTAPISSLMPESQTFADGGKLLVAAKAFTPDESKVYLKRDMISRGYQPVQITIENNTSKTFSLSASSVDLPSASPGRIAFKIVAGSGLGRSIGYKIASFVFWPFAIPGTIDTIRSLRTYKMLKNDFIAKSMKQEILAPYSKMNRMIYVPVEGFKEKFKVTLIDLETMEPHTFQTTACKGELLN